MVMRKEAQKLIIPKQSGIYYKPFGRREPVIIRSLEAIQELCEASQLFQRAVYADVCYLYLD